MRGCIALVAALVCLAAWPAAAQPAAPTAIGDWLGGIVASPAETLRVAVHIHKTDSGGYAGTLDSLDRANYDLALSDIVVASDTLSFGLPLKAAPATFTGKWDAGAGRWVGKWAQSNQSIDLVLSPGVATPAPPIAGLDGAWSGVLAAPAGQLHIVLHVKTGRDGTATWLDSPDQLAYGLNVGGFARTGADIGFQMPALAVVFKGTLAADGQSIAGQFTQSGTPIPLTLTRSAAKAPAFNRPQTPKKPYPYREDEVAFDDASPKVRLAGTLTRPAGAGPFPAVVLIAGSGPNTRNEPILGHQLFLVLADDLTRHGIAVLRYDKRGTGASTGDYAKATTRDFADDAEAAAAWLRAQPGIDAGHVGLIGHSEGGLIAPMVAAGDPKIAFVVMMAGPGVDGIDVLMEQGRLIMKAMGANDAFVADNSTLRRQLFDIVHAEKNPDVTAAKLKAALDDYAKAKDLPPEAAEAQAAMINSDWFRFFYDYDPAPTLARLRCPVLALNGSKDLQVSPAQNLPPIRAALAHNPRAEIDELPGLNHVFQTATTGAPGEYGQIEETIAPSALDKITGWILKTVGAKAVAR